MSDVATIIHTHADAARNVELASPTQNGRRYVRMKTTVQTDEGFLTAHVHGTTHVSHGCCL
jgi:hypothetical protein